MSSKRDWTEDLPELFEGYTEAEPKGLWEAVEAGSAASAGRRRMAAWWYAGGAMLAAAAVVAAVILFRPAADPSQIQVIPGEILAEEAAQSAPASQDGSPSLHPSGQPDPSQQSWAPPVTAAGGYGSKRDSVLPDDLTASSATVETATETPGDSTVEAESVEITSNEPETESAGQTVVPLERQQVQYQPQPRKHQRPQIKLQAGVYGGTLMAQAVSNSATGFGNAASATVGASPSIQTKSISGGSTTFDPSIVGRNKPSTTESNHRQTARYGAGIKVSFLPHWGIETGISATTLNSSSQTTTGNSVQSSEREMTYLGIPLYLHFNALQWRNLSLYLAAGPMYEFMNSTSETVSTRFNGKLLTSATDNTLIKDHRWSANIGAGLQLEFMDNNAIYIQPGFSYHFGNGSALVNYYTERPASFNLTIGYRLLLF